MRWDLQTGYSYGFGFVKYVKGDDAARAINALNGIEYLNKRLKVSYARPPGQDIKNSNLYVTNLPKTINEDVIENMFGEFGQIVQKNILKDKITGMPRGVAFVRYLADFTAGVYENVTGTGYSFKGSPSARRLKLPCKSLTVSFWTAVWSPFQSK